MSLKTRVGAWMMVLGLLGAAACASIGSVSTTTPTKFTRVNVSVHGWAVEAVLIDRDGRRSGWTREGAIEQINGCIGQSGWEDGIPNPRPEDSDSADVAAWEEAQRQDSIYAASSPPPTWHSFSIGNDMNYRAGGSQSLIEQGGCELRLVPINAGAVTLSLRAEGIGIRARRDTTSTLVTPGKPQRWRLTWKQSGDSCIVKISRLGERRSAK